MNRRIDVTRAFLPPIEEYLIYLNTIWENGILTNEGPLLKDFKTQLEVYLGVENLEYVTNGTLALQLALESLGLKPGSEVITTPFSYVATTSAILWEKMNPVFVDIEEDTFNIDPQKIEEAITPNTAAILAVHVFGNPCNIKEIKKIAKKHNLKVVYDGAHAFGVKYDNQSIFNFGDISTCSFHSTKLFNTIEGGCVVSRNKELMQNVELAKRFGHTGDEHYQLGINAKASEFQAAMGLCNLKYIDAIIYNRKQAYNLYLEKLKNRFKTQNIENTTDYNYSYFPIVFENNSTREIALGRLNKYGIFPRKYFTPSLNKLPYIQSEYICEASERLSDTILCLPLYYGIDETDINKICEVLLNDI